MKECLPKEGDHCVSPDRRPILDVRSAGKPNEVVDLLRERLDHAVLHDFDSSCRTAYRRRGGCGHPEVM